VSDDGAGERVEFEGARASRSCSIDVLCAPTRRAPSMRFSIDDGDLDAERVRDRDRFAHHARDRLDQRVVGHLDERGAR
jgi:hypothetical protein